MEENERAEEAAGARITKKKTKSKVGGGRQAKLTSGVAGSGSSLKETQPSPFAEIVTPVIPEFSAEGKKPSGRGRGKVKAEPKTEEEGTITATSEDQKQKKLKFDVKDEEHGNSKKPLSSKSSKPGASQAKKRKVKEMVDSFIISSDSDGEGEEEIEIEKKSLRERIELRKTKTTDYKEVVLSGDESVDSEGSWKSGSEAAVDSPPIKKVKVASAAGKGHVKTSEVVPQPVTDSSKPQGAGKGKKTAAKQATKKVSSSSGSSGEKKKQKPVLGKKPRVVSLDIYSDESDDIQSGSDNDSFTVPAKKKVAAEVSQSSLSFPTL